MQLTMSSQTRSQIAQIVQLSGAILLSAIIGVALTGCNYLLGPRSQPPTSVKIERNSGVCLKTLAANISLWAETGRPDIGESIDCSVKAVDDFTASADGQVEGTYSRPELTQFFGTYFSKGGEFLGTNTDTWIDQLLHLKQLLFGGAADRVTKAEIKRVRDLFVSLKPSLAKLSPHVQVVLFKADAAAPGESSEGEAAILALTQRLAEELSRSEQNRPSTDLDGLVKMIRLLGFRSGRLENWLPLAKSLKGIAVGGEPAVIVDREWSSAITKIGQAWALAVHVKYDLARATDPLGSGIGNVEYVIGEGLNLLKGAIEAQSKTSGPRAFDRLQGIARERIEDLIDSLFDLDHAGEISLLQGKFVNLTPDIVKKLLTPLLGKILYGNSKPNIPAHVAGFTMDHYQVLKDAIYDWLWAQKQIAVHDQTEINIAELVRDFDVSRAEILKNQDPSIRTASLRARAQMMDILSRGRPLARSQNPTYGDRLIVSKVVPLKLSRRDLDFQNAIRAAFDLIMRGYGHDAAVVAQDFGVTDLEAQEVYLDIRDLGKAIGFMDVRNNSSGTRTFMEASIFTSVGTGDTHIAIHEIVDWFHFISTAGAMADRAYDLMSGMVLTHLGKQSACSLPSIDVLGKHRLQVGCFRSVFRKNFSEWFSNLPGFSKWVSDKRFPNRINEVEMAAEDAGRLRGFNDSPLESDEVRAIIPIVNYTESIFVRFDRNSNDVLDEDELWAAFPVIKPFIRKMANGHAEDEEMQRAIFSYLIVHGSPPKSDLGGDISLIWHRYVGEKFTHLSADRTAVLKLIGSFSQVGRDGREKAVEAYLKDHDKNLRSVILAHDPNEVATWNDLFQCQPAAIPILSRLFQDRVDVIAPSSGKLGSPADTSMRIKSLIEADPQLQYLCEPF
jgi:hypothetical protein